MTIILVVEDNEDILFDEMLILELHGYEGISAINGEDALNKLNGLDVFPDLIISDIMMPKMNGYDFYREVSNNPKWSKIPFIFLSAKSSPEDVRFAKYIGADDYIIKPFTEEVFLSRIESMLVQKDKQLKFQKELDEKIEKMQDRILPKDLEEEINIKKNTVIISVFWDDLAGPKMKNSYSSNIKLKYKLDDVAYQLYNVAVGLYGYEGFFGAEGILLKIANIGMDGYIYFNAFEDYNLRGKKQLFMLGVISPKIHFLASIKIKDILSKISEKIRNKEEIDFQEEWENIIRIL